MPSLIATKSLVYANRRMQVGEAFPVRSERDARVLVAIGKASRQRVAGQVAPPPAELLAKVASTTDDKAGIKKLRADYLTLLGKKPFGGWDEAELQRRIDEALAS